MDPVVYDNIQRVVARREFSSLSQKILFFGYAGGSFFLFVILPIMTVGGHLLGLL